MTTCSFYSDKKGREYYLPSKTIQDYERDKRPHTEPQGCKKVRSRDGYVIYILSSYPYPAEVQDVFRQFINVPFEESKKQLSSLKCSKALFKRVITPFAAFPEKPLSLIFYHLDKSSLASLALSCKRFFGLARNPDLKNLCLNAHFENHTQILFWAIKQGCSCHSVALRAAWKGDLHYLDQLRNQGARFSWKVYDELLIYMKRADAHERLAITTWAIRTSGEHKEDFRFFAAEMAIEKRDLAMLKACASMNLKLSFETLKKLRKERDISIIEVLLNAHPNLEPNGFFYAAAQSGDEDFIKWAVSAINKGRWTMLDGSLLEIAERVVTLAKQNGHNGVISEMKY